MPVVTITTGAHASLDRYYEAIRAQLAARYHQPGNSFSSYTPSEQELAEMASLASHAAHASDNLHVNGTHIERLIK